jgi:hypothetical protein
MQGQVVGEGARLHSQAARSVCGTAAGSSGDEAIASRAFTAARHAARISRSTGFAGLTCTGTCKEVVMSADTKTPFEHVNDTVLQLKEMRHYAKNNVELLTTQWLLFDGELSKLKRAEKIEQLMTLQGQFYDGLEEAIADLEELSVELQPPPPEE